MKKYWKVSLFMILVFLVTAFGAVSFANENMNKVFENWNLFFSDDKAENEIQNDKLKEQEAVFYILRKDISLNNISEKDFEEDIYVETGKGKILVGEDNITNEEQVKEAVKTVPDISSYIAQNEEVVWYSVQKKDMWSVYGKIQEKSVNETKKTEKAKFFILKDHQKSTKEGEKYTTSQYAYTGEGTIYKMKTDTSNISNEDEVSNILASVPQISKYINENEKVIWYGAKKESDGWHIDGEVVRRYPRIITVESMKEFKAADVITGDRVITTGYYKKDDGNGGRYQIKDKIAGEINDGTRVKLDNGYYADMIIENNTISVGQFGGIGDGEFDNSTALKNIFSAPKNLKIVFPKGEYKVTDSILISKVDNCEIVGNDSVIFTEGDYNPTSSNTMVLYFEHNNAITLRNLNVESRNPNQEKANLQFVVNNTTGFTMENCKFVISEAKLTKADGRVKFCTGSFKTGWKDVVIRNCEFINFSDSNEGGLLGFNNQYAETSGNLLFENNKCYYKGHDEMMAIFSNKTTSIENLKFINNEFYALDSDNQPRDFCFSLGYVDGYKVDNIVFKDNIFETSSNTSFMYFGASSNVSIENNTIKYKQITDKSLPIVFRGDKVELKNNIIIKNNKITLENDAAEEAKIEAISSGKIKMENNDIVSKMFVYTMFRDNGVANANNIVLENGMWGITRLMSSFSDNIVDVHGAFRYLFNYNDLALDENVEIKNNTINCMEMDDELQQTAILLRGTQLNNHSFVFSGNKLNTAECQQEDQFYYINLKDVEAQKVEIKNNETGAFKNGVVENKLVEKFDIE